MVRKTTAKTKVQKKEDATNEKEHKKADADNQPAETHEILMDDKAKKLSPKNPGFVYFQLGKCIKTGELELKMIGNDGGGLHSKEWIKLSEILKILDKQVADKPFKSAVLKPVFSGASANNPSFLAAVLRSPAVSLLDLTEKSAFLHRIHGDFKSRRDALLKLGTAK